MARRTRPTQSPTAEGHLHHCGLGHARSASIACNCFNNRNDAAPERAELLFFSPAGEAVPGLEPLCDTRHRPRERPGVAGPRWSLHVSPVGLGAASKTGRAAHRAAVDHRWFAAEGLGARPRPPRAPRRPGASPTGRPYHSIRPLGRRRGGPTLCRPARASGAETGASRDGARAAAAWPSSVSDVHRRRARSRGKYARPRSSGARRQRCARGRPGFVRESVSRAISSDRSFAARRRPPHG